MHKKNAKMHAAGRRICLIILQLILLCLAGDLCLGDEAPEGKKLRVVATIFPLMDWTTNLAEGSGAEVVFLQNTGADLHSFQASAQDIMTISSCDLFIYVGGESDSWTEGMLNTEGGPVTLNLMEAIKDHVLAEQTVEGMQEDEEEEEEGGYDEHIWLSLVNADACCRAIADTLCELDPADEKIYRDNCEKYCEELEKLNSEYSESIAASPLKTVMFADRFPFLYMMHDYGLEYYAAFNGCSAETEASFETVTFLIEKADELELPAVLVLEGSDQKLAGTIVDNTKNKDTAVLEINAMQTVTGSDADAGMTYLSVMEDNLEVLLKALS